MNPTAQRYLPPLLVIGAAAYFGWPPSQPLDLGDDIVRANSVRWKASQLDAPSAFNVRLDPFRPMVADTAEEEAAAVQEPEVPPGPDPASLQAGLSLDGFANTAGRRWAIINGRPRLAGELVSTTGADPQRCEIVEIRDDHVIVRCEQTMAEIRPTPSGARATKASTTSAPTQPVMPTSPAARDIPPPPQV